jgi:hypothetical protein
VYSGDMMMDIVSNRITTNLVRNNTMPRSIEAITDHQKLKSYLLEALKTYNTDPPDTEFQRGYLGALLALFEDLCMTGNERLQHRILEMATLQCRRID